MGTPRDFAWSKGNSHTRCDEPVKAGGLFAVEWLLTQWIASAQKASPSRRQGKKRASKSV
jgi:hypothetical protein